MQISQRVSAGLLAMVMAASMFAVLAAPPARADDGPGASISAGNYHSCGLKVDGTLTCWGGVDPTVTPPPGEFTAVSAGGYYSCGLTFDDAAAVCWGEDAEFAGDVPEGAFTAISAGGSSACGLRSDNSIDCWGFGFSGETAPDGEFSAVSAGADHACGLNMDQAIVCWGSNEHARSSPVPAGNFNAVSAGGQHTCGLKSDQSIICWGDNWAEQTSPVPTGSFIGVSAGNLHTCGLKVDGSVLCWGGNGAINIPTATYSEVSAGGEHSCGRKTDGDVVCWGGSNQYGEQSVPDADGDRVSDLGDVFPGNPNETKDTVGDGVGDNADDLPTDPGETNDADGDGVGDNADPNDDYDDVPDVSDNCPMTYNPAQTDSDADGVGNACDASPRTDPIASSVSIDHGKSFYGRVGSARDACRRGRTVRLFRKVAGDDTLVDSTVSKRDPLGKWVIPDEAQRRGTYYVRVVKKSFIASSGAEFTCSPARSADLAIGT